MTNSTIEQEIIKLAHDWIEAVGQRDRATLERILADDFLIAGWLPGGQLGDKQTYIEDCLRPVILEQASYQYDLWRFRIYEDIAIVNCILEIHALIEGNDWGGIFLSTQVWMKRSERWQVAASHSSPVLGKEGEAGS